MVNKNKLLVKHDVLSRTQYKKIKSMDKEHLSQYLYNLCLVTARNLISTLSEEKLFLADEFMKEFESRICEVKGIGKERQKTLCSFVRDMLNEMDGIQIVSEERR